MGAAQQGIPLHLHSLVFAIGFPPTITHHVSSEIKRNELKLDSFTTANDPLGMVHFKFKFKTKQSNLLGAPEVDLNLD